MDYIRNFVIIAHIDHGKSTLADRFLEVTGTVEARKMKAQYLDQLELERERGITIKMAPVRMSLKENGKEYVLNLIDTPGHSDFSYEVSRSLEAVEGAVLLVDITQGIQAQTLATFYSAKHAGLTVLGAVNKVDLVHSSSGSGSVSPESVERIIKDLADLIGCDTSEIHRVSGKTGEGALGLLSDVVRCVPPPKPAQHSDNIPGKALIFDSFYDNHKGVVASVRVFEGAFSNTDEITLIAGGINSKIKELGFFTPEFTPVKSFIEGEIGYIATGIKDPGKIKIGDTVLVKRGKIENIRSYILPGYTEPRPVIFTSFYPEDGDEYDFLRQSLEKLRLNDSSLSIEPDQNEVLGRGFKVGCLGKLHFEIATERLKREFKINVINTFPSVLYKIKTREGWMEIVKPEDLPQDYMEIWEPMISVKIIFPSRYLSQVFSLQKTFRMKNLETETMGERMIISAEMPLTELVSDFDDTLKSSTEGYASFSYEITEHKKADVVRADLLVSGEVIPGLSRFLPKETSDRESRRMVEKLKELLPRRQFTQPIQAAVNGKIIARADVPALRKDVTGYLYGGDRTRKMKLWKKQQRGKKRLQERSEATISPEVFKELLKRD